MLAFDYFNLFASEAQSLVWNKGKSIGGFASLADTTLLLDFHAHGA